MTRSLSFPLKALVALLLSVFCSCSIFKPAELTPEEQARRDAERQADSLAFLQAAACLETMNFIIVPSSIQINGQRTHFAPNEMTNFVCATGGKGIIQLSSARNPFPGPNGMGGITADGTIKLTRQRTGKKGDRTFEYNIMGRASATVTVNLPRNGTRASVRITSNIYPGSLSINGRVVPYDAERLTIGAPLF